MKTPTRDQIRRYEQMLDAVVSAQAAGQPSEDLERELKAFQIETGIADEPPATDFPELADASDEGKP